MRACGAAGAVACATAAAAAGAEQPVAFRCAQRARLGPLSPVLPSPTTTPKTPPPPHPPGWNTLSLNKMSKTAAPQASQPLRIALQHGVRTSDWMLCLNAYNEPAPRPGAAGDDGRSVYKARGGRHHGLAEDSRTDSRVGALSWKACISIYYCGRSSCLCCWRAPYCNVSTPCSPSSHPPGPAPGPASRRTAGPGSRATSAPPTARSG